MKNLLKEICKICSVSGGEEYLIDFCKKIFSSYTDDITTDEKNNNLYATFGKKNAKKRILLDAHIDEVGFIINYINEKGLIKVSPVGGIDKRILPGSQVMILNKEKTIGVFGSVPPHLSKSKSKFLSIDELYIDIGLNDKEKVEELVKIGDRAIIYSEPRELINDKFVAGSLDNKAGVAALILCAEEISKIDLDDICVTIALTSREEVNSLGAKVASYLLDPTECICIDVSFASQNGVPKHKCGEMAKGPMIGFSPIINKGIYNKLISICKENDINYQLEVMGGRTGTNLDYMTESKSGIKGALVSIPIRYMHSWNEVVDVNDIKDVAKLISLYIKNGGRL